MLDAKLGYNLSLLWSSFRASFELVKELMFWLIGNGKTTNIWDEKWVLMPSSFQVQSITDLLPKNSKVVVLIDLEVGDWNRELVYQLFLMKKLPPYVVSRLVYTRLWTNSFVDMKKWNFLN